MAVARAVYGFSLIEVLIGVFLSTLLTAGIVQLLTASVSAYRLQLAQSRLEESSRYARDVLVFHISQAGYQPEPWRIQPALPAVTAESRDGAALPGDQLGLQRWSRQNCYGNENPVTDGGGLPAFYLLRISFAVNASENLAISCRYGPDAARLRTQINNFGLVEGVEALQVLYGEDRDGDDLVDNWVTAQAWLQESEVKSIKAAMLLSTARAFEQPANGLINLLDEVITSPADGRLRKTRSFTTAIRGRLR